MRLIFDPGDDDAYNDARHALLDELDGWLDLPEIERVGTVANVGFLLDWRFHDSSGVLDELAPSDVVEFLLEWCPRRLKGHTDAAEYVCNAVGVYVDFMGATGRLIGGVERATHLRRLAEDLTATVRAEIRNPTPVEDLSDEHDESVELPFVYVPPSAVDVEAAAAAAPLLATLEALRDYLSPDGNPLTDKGNLKLADGRALVKLLDTGDEMDPQIGDRTWRTVSTANLPRLNFILDIAKQTGAIRVHQRRLVPVKAWGTRPIVTRAEALFAAIVQLGPLESQSSGRILYFNDLHELLDDGIVHWLAPLVEDAAELPFESFLEWAQSVVSRQIAPDWPNESELFDKFTQQDMSRIFEVLEQAGVVQWTDRAEVTESYGLSYWAGGTVALTALGRHVLPDYLDDAGYVLRRADGLADCDGADLIEALLSVDETQQDALIAGWQANRPAVERVQMLTQAVAATSSAASRMMGFVALHNFDIDVVEPLVRQLLDTPVAGHAALWLIQGDRADPVTLASFVDVAVLVDVLSSTVESPEELCSLFAGMSEPLGLLESMWRHPAPETALVLDALGSHLPDKALAKAARKAAIRHRSWIANRS